MKPLFLIALFFASSSAFAASCLLPYNPGSGANTSTCVSESGWVTSFQDFSCAGFYSLEEVDGGASTGVDTTTCEIWYAGTVYASSDCDSQGDLDAHLGDWCD